jgi:WD repeat-containing protein mio
MTERLEFCCCANDVRRDDPCPDDGTDSRTFECQKCQKPTADCAICLLPVTMVNTYLDQEKIKKNMDKLELEGYQFEEGVIWCQNCKHGGHYYHIMEWFSEYNTCAVTDCPCQCNLLY